ncbi:MAG: hypothetical protein HPY65_18015 [Syntrophaceae bacterium]|nr:hypothetical protein [Syntrophaceae bacterium]
MKKKSVLGIIYICMLCLLGTQAWSENILNSDSDYSIKIAVTINEDDFIMGKLEYSNKSLQLVTFNPIVGIIHVEPYLFIVLEKAIVSRNVHRIKCRPLNDKYGSSEITGVIDFSNELKPRIHLVNASGYTYVSNMSDVGKRNHEKYIPNVWLGH